MMWNHDVWGGGDWLAMLLMMVLVLVVFGALVVLFVRGGPAATAQPRHDADDVPGARDARGQARNDLMLPHGAGRR